MHDPMVTFANMIAEAVKEIPRSIKDAMAGISADMRANFSSGGGGPSNPGLNNPMHGSVSQLISGLTGLVRPLAAFRGALETVTGGIATARRHMEAGRQFQAGVGLGGSPGSSQSRQYAWDLIKNRSLPSNVRSGIRASMQDVSKSARELTRSRNKVASFAEQTRKAARSMARTRTRISDFSSRRQNARAESAKELLKIRKRLNVSRQTVGSYSSRIKAETATLNTLKRTVGKLDPTFLAQAKKIKGLAKEKSKIVSRRDVLVEKRRQLISSGKSVSSGYQRRINRLNRQLKGNGNAYNAAARQHATWSGKVGAARGAMGVAQSAMTGNIAGAAGMLAGSANPIGIAVSLAQLTKYAYEQLQVLRENTRAATHQALSVANPFSGVSIGASVQLQVGDMLRRIQMSQETGGTAAKLTMAENSNRQAWLRNDINMQNMSNEFNTFLANRSSELGSYLSLVSTAVRPFWKFGSQIAEGMWKNTRFGIGADMAQWIVDKLGANGIIGLGEIDKQDIGMLATPASKMLNRVGLGGIHTFEAARKSGRIRSSVLSPRMAH